MKTRDKIQKTALTLFNERGEAHVSLGQIAQRLGISEGNLWYHFRTKDDLVTALFTELEARIESHLSRVPAEFGPSIVDFAEHARRSYRFMWDYRFLYRHRCDPERESALAARITQLIERTHRHVEGVLAEMVRRGLMRASPAEIADLAVNAWIISRYWLDYLQERHGRDKISENDLQAGVKQLFALYHPYLTETALAEAASTAPPKRKMAQG